MGTTVTTPSRPTAHPVLLRVDEAATMLAVSRATIYRWADEGKLEKVTLPNGRLRITARSVTALLRKMGVR